MHRERKRFVIASEDSRSSIALMYIAVDYGNSIDAFLCSHGADCNCHVIENTEPLTSFGKRVMCSTSVNPNPAPGTD